MLQNSTSSNRIFMKWSPFWLKQNKKQKIMNIETIDAMQNNKLILSWPLKCLVRSYFFNLKKGGGGPSCQSEFKMI